jgi:mRNA-degrading endonuclease RelE of RelBE toxin-antitoxin system
LQTCKIKFSKESVRTLVRLPQNTAVRLPLKIWQLAEDPTTLTNNVGAIIGEPGAFRLRIGTWRIVFFRLEGSVMRVRLITSPGAD